MATLAIPLVGAGLGSFIGIGSSFGFLIGSVIANILFPPPPIVTEGPRLGDTSVSASTYGVAIPLGYGTVRMSGNMIWSSGIREQENRREVSGGKGGLGGGQSQVQVTYTYFASFAMSFAATEADQVLRIWADSKVIYDATGTSTSRKSGLRFRFYDGSESQLPDGLIEADKGDGQVPAHRDLCYIVFDDLQLTDFGNRIPNVTAEIAFRAEGANSLRFSNELTAGSIQIDNLAIDRKRRRLYLLDENVVSESFVRAYSYDTLQQLRLEEVATVSGEELFGRIHAGQFTGDIYGRRGTSNFEPISIVDPNTLQVRQTSSGSTIGSLDQCVEIGAVGALGEVKAFLLVKNDFGLTENRLGLMEVSTATVLTSNFSSSTIPNPIAGITPGPLGAEATAWVAQKDDGNVSMGLWRLTVNPLIDPSTGGLVEPVTMEQVATFSPSLWDNDADINETVLGPIRDPEDGGLIFAIGISGARSFVWKWREGVGVVWTATVNAQTLVRFQTFVNTTQVSDGLIGWADSAGTACMLDTRDGTVIVDGFDGSTLSGSYDPSGAGFFDGPTQSVVNIKGIGSGSVGFLQQLFLNRFSGLGVQLSDIVEDISSRVGLDPAADLDTSELTDTVKGYVVARQMTARQAIEPLSSAFFFEGVESDFQVKFPKRGKDPVATIAQADLAPTSDDGEVLPEQRTQEVELPERISVQYLDKDTDYQQGTQSSKRVLAPFPAMRSRAEQTVPYAIVFNATEAKQIAEQLLFSGWNERTGYRWEAGPEFLTLDPADVVAINLDSGVSIEARIAKMTVRGDLSIGFDGVSEAKTTFSSDALSDGGLGFPQKPPPSPADTNLIMLNVPLLRDVDATGGVASRSYFAMSGFVDGWDGGELRQSLDSGTTYDEVARALSAASYGTIVNALPATSLPFQTDTATTLRVVMQIGELASVTNDQFLNDANVAVVGSRSSQNWEIVAFRDVTEVAEGVYDVSHLMRARRGTDPFTDGHSDGELLVVLDRDTVNAFLLALGQIDNALPYKAVGFSQILEDADVVSFTGLGRDLMPYAPAHLDASLDGSNNVDLSWVRRTRIGGELRGGTGTVPVAEASEEYEVDIKDGPGGTVVRTVTGLTSPAYEYTTADQTTDGFSPPMSAITFEVFQISDAVGRGFGSEATITL